VRAETEQKTSENERLRKEARDVEKRDEERARAEQKAAQFYDLVRQGKRIEVVEGWENMKKEPITKAEEAMFGDAVERARNELAASSYELGMDKARVARWAEAAGAFEDSLKYKDSSAIAPNVRLGLADAYRHLGRPRDAIPMLTQLADTQSTDRELQDDALHLLALCQMDIEAWNEAKNTWRALVRRFPDSHFTPEGKLQLMQLNALH
jgi:TolA-binding protein